MYQFYSLIQNLIFRAYIYLFIGILFPLIIFNPALSQSVKILKKHNSLQQHIESFSNQELVSELTTKKIFNTAKQTISKTQLTLNSLNIVNAASLSTISPNKLSEYLQDYLSTSKQFADSTVIHWYGKNSKIATIEWSLSNSKIDSSFKTLAIFSNDGSIIFDEFLSNVILKISKLQSYSIIENRDTQGLEAAVRVSSLTGSVVLHWRVKFTAEVSPYISPQTNDGSFDLNTNEITCWKTDPTGIPPQGNPVVYFGNSGTISDKDDPFESPISIDGSVDHFHTGTYTSTVYEGKGDTWKVSFGVSFYGSISIDPPSDTKTPIWLGAVNSSGRAINVLDKVYRGNAITERRYHGIFWNSGNLTFNNFITRVEQGGNEKGSISVKIPVNCAYTFWDVLAILQDIYYAGTIPLSVEYVRGHKIPDPVGKMTTSYDSCDINQQISINLRVTNISSAVNIESGNINLEIGSLNGSLSVMGNATKPLGTINQGEYKDYTFTLKGVNNGIVRPQATITGRWGWPAGDAGKTFSVPISLDQNIIVDVCKSELNSQPKEFTLFQNYPNPFNPKTNISFTLPKAAHINISSYDINGNLVVTIFEGKKSSGFHSIPWNASDLPSGIYFIKIFTGSNSVTRKAIILK